MPGGMHLDNENPLIYQRSGERILTAEEEDEDIADPIDDREIFDILVVYITNVSKIHAFYFVAHNCL